MKQETFYFLLSSSRSASGQNLTRVRLNTVREIYVSKSHSRGAKLDWWRTLSMEAPSFPRCGQDEPQLGPSTTKHVCCALCVARSQAFKLSSSQARRNGSWRKVSFPLFQLDTLLDWLNGCDNRLTSVHVLWQNLTQCHQDTTVLECAPFAFQEPSRRGKFRSILPPRLYT